MVAPKIKHIPLLTKPITRKRDGELLTHHIQIALTTDEALAISDLFERSKSKETFGEYRPASTSLIRAALLLIAEKGIDENTLLEEMAKWRTRADLATTQSASDRDKALNFLVESKKPKPFEPKKDRRVFIPEPRRR